MARRGNRPHGTPGVPQKAPSAARRATVLLYVTAGRKSRCTISGFTMTTQRAVLLVFAVLALSLGAMSIASLTAWERCGRGDDCSTDLAIAAVDAVPAAIIGSLVVVLLRSRALGRRLRAAMLSLAVALATLPLASFVLRELWGTIVFAVLLGCLVLLVVTAEDQAPERPEAVVAEPERAPARPREHLPVTPDLMGLLNEVTEVTLRIGELCGEAGGIGRRLASVTHDAG